MKELISVASRDGRLEGIRYGAYVQRDDGHSLTKSEFYLPTDNVVGGWCDVYVKHWQVPYSVVTFGTTDEGCVDEAIWRALDDLSMLDGMSEATADIPEETREDVPAYDVPVSDDQRTEINNLITELAMMHNVSFGTAKGALMRSDAAKSAKVYKSADLKLSWQADVLIGQLERWLEVSDNG